MQIHIYPCQIPQRHNKQKIKNTKKTQLIPLYPISARPTQYTFQTREHQGHQRTRAECTRKVRELIPILIPKKQYKG